MSVVAKFDAALRLTVKYSMATATFQRRPRHCLRRRPQEGLELRQGTILGPTRLGRHRHGLCLPGHSPVFASSAEQETAKL